MGKYVVAVALLGVYAAVAAWVVRGEGESYRAARHRGEAGTTERIAAKPPEPPNPPPTPVASPVVPAIDTRPEPTHPEPPVSVAKAETREPRADPPAVKDVAPARPPAEAPLKPDQFWSSPRMKEVWDPTNLGVEQEKRLGLALHDLILELNPPFVEGPFLRRAEQAAKPLLETLHRKDIPYTFTILDSDAVNAFSHPGGYVYLSRGLFDFIGADEGEDFVLQFVIGHEMAHVDLQHAIKCLQDPDLKNSGLGTLPQFYFFILPLGYPERMDFAADRWAYDRMIRPLDRTRHESLMFLRRFQGYAKEHGFENGRAQLKANLKTRPRDPNTSPPRQSHAGPSGRLQTAGRAHGAGREARAVNAAEAVRPTSRNPSAIAAPLGPVRSVSAGK